MVDPLKHGPRYTDAVVSARAPTNLIQNNKALLAGIVQDVRRLRHLDHKGTLPAVQFVARSNTCEDAICETNGRGIGGDKTANVRKNDQQCGLSVTG